MKNVKMINWSKNFAYAIGLLTTDGSLSKDGRHIDFTSKDKIQVKNFMSCLEIKNKIGKKYSGAGRLSWRIQFGNTVLYKFLLNIGLRPNKSKILGKILIPDKYLFDFLRGHFDGDGTFYSYWDPRWRSSFMFYLEFTSASKRHIHWLRKRISDTIRVNGHITKTSKKDYYQLKYAKSETLKILPKIYYDKKNIFLLRKYLKIRKVLGIIGKENLI